jgi:hypothetical protein
VGLGVLSAEGATDVPADESVSPNAETPGAAAVGPTLMAVVGADAFAPDAGEEAIPVEAGAVPIGVGWGDGELAGAVPDGVRMSAAAVLGAEKIVDVGVVVAVAELLAVVAPPGLAAEVPM